MWNKIDISNYLNNRKDWPLLDVRTPAEFEKGHVPGAFSFPLFNNEERVIVGTSYKQESPRKALKKGLELVGPKLAYFVEQAEILFPRKQVAIHCWRGGKRSASLAWLLDFAGFEVQLVNGGYKAYRQHVLRSFERSPKQLVVLGGRTGCGKTVILKTIENKQEQFIDLEGLANHKGSAFGTLGTNEQPQVEQFENDLAKDWEQLDNNRIVWLENESRSIGRVYIPQGLWDQMKKAPLINIEVPFDWRVDNLVKDYAQYPKPLLIAAFEKIKKRIGGLNLKLAKDALAKDDFHQAANIALRYYDKAYQYMLDNNSTPNIHHLNISDPDPEKIADLLIDYVQSTFKTTI